MRLTIDARVPVLFGARDEAADAAWLIQGEAPDAAPGRPVAHFQPADAGHAPGCACCVARGPAAEALGRLFLARARGDVVFFKRVVAVVQNDAGAQAVRDAVASDPVAMARFRLG